MSGAAEGSEGVPGQCAAILRGTPRLLDGAHGAGKQLGGLRRPQGWLGGTRAGNAVFVPPPAEQAPALLADPEGFTHAAATNLPPMIEVALIDAQLETIHLFVVDYGLGYQLAGSLWARWADFPLRSFLDAGVSAPEGVGRRDGDKSGAGMPQALARNFCRCFSRSDSLLL